MTPSKHEAAFADAIMNYFNARERRIALESALAQARHAETQAAYHVQDEAPGPGMYYVGQRYVVVSPDEVFPAEAPVEVRCE